MNTFDEIKDIELNTYLSLENEVKDERENVGTKPEDFEIIQLLGEGGFGHVFKVISKLNNKVYAMKVANLSEIRSDKGEKGVKLTLNESKYLTVLTHPHIIKYYTSFQKDDDLYLIIENAENGDLDSYIEANKKIGRHIPEDELWSIFLQCMQGLTYIHHMKVIHRDIKLKNILMDNNMTIKIGDFGTCAVKKNKDSKNENPKYLNANYGDILNQKDMQYNRTHIISEHFTAQEVMNNLDYDQKIDVYSMGVTFYYMCYYSFPSEGLKKNDMGYSKEMLEIINEMIEQDKNKRKSSKYFLEIIQKEFYKRYNRNTSIDAIVRCLYSFKDLTHYYKSLKSQEIKDKYITNSYVQCLNNITGQDINLYFDSIKYFREILCTQNTKFDKTKEINPKLVFAFLLSQLHQEMNLGNITFEDRKNEHYITPGLEEILTVAIEMLLKFENKFFTKLNSFIIRKFVGLEEKSSQCFNCKLETYSYSGYFCITLDMEKISQYMGADIENFFNYRKNIWITTEKYCPKCLIKTQHALYKKYFTSPDYLIVFINRGSNDSYRNVVRLKQTIDLTNLTVTLGKKYKLNGFIAKNYENGKYDSYFEFRYNKKWFRCENENIKEISQIELNQILNDVNGEIMMAFYEELKEDNKN